LHAFQLRITDHGLLVTFTAMCCWSFVKSGQEDERAYTSQSERENAVRQWLKHGWRPAE